MAANDFRLLGSAQLAWLHERGAALVAGWAGDWLRDAAPDIRVHPADHAPPPPGPWLTLALGDAACSVRRVVGVAERLMFGAAAMQQPSELAREAADAAWVDLAQRCLAAGASAVPSGQAPPAAAWRRGSGALRIDLVWPAGETALLLDGRATAHWLAARHRPPRAAPARMHDLRAASGHGRLRLKAWSGAAEIDIATLQSLAVGDVIPLDLRIDEPLCVSVDGRPALARAFLGTQGGRRALRLTAGFDQPDSSNREAHP